MDRYRLLNWILLIVSVIFAVGIIRSFARISQREGIITNTQDQLQRAQNDNSQLKRQLAEVQSTQYIESQARDKLNLGKEGEVVLLLPTISPFDEPAPAPVDSSPNWEKWWKVFF